MITATIPGGAVQLTGNPAYINCSGGSAPVNSSEYKIMLKIISVDGVLNGAPFVDAITPDSNGNAVFDISGYVDQPVTAVFQWPVSGAVVTYPTQAFSIQVQVGERYIDADNLLVETWGATSTTFQMLKGGLSPRQVAVMRDAGDTFYAKYIEEGRFLTARSWGQFVHPTQPIKLWFMPAANGSATLTIKYYFDDGTNGTFTSAVSLDVDNLYEFNVNPALLGVNIQPSGKKVSHFDVSLPTVSESRRFTYDWAYCERPVFLMFANTFGGVDDVYLSGYIQEKFTTNGSISYRPQQPTDTVYTPTLLQLDKTGQNRWSINTGWKWYTELQYMRDLLVAKQAWYVYSNLTQTSVSIIPITDIQTGELLFDRKEDLYSIQIDFSEAHESKHSFDNRAF